VAKKYAFVMKIFTMKTLCPCGVINGDPRHSDHRPVIVDVGDRDFRRSGSSMKVLKKFEARWLERRNVLK